MQHVKESEQKYRGGDSGVKYLVRGPKIDWGVILLLPGQALGGHYHQEVEETFYVLHGKGTFIVNGQASAVGEGDVLRMEPTDKHDIRNDSAAPMKMVFIKCPYLPQDRVDI